MIILPFCSKTQSHNLTFPFFTVTHCHNLCLNARFIRSMLDLPPSSSTCPHFSFARIYLSLYLR